MVLRTAASTSTARLRPAATGRIGVADGKDFATGPHGETVRFCLAILRDRQGGPIHPILPALPRTAAARASRARPGGVTTRRLPRQPGICEWQA